MLYCVVGSCNRRLVSSLLPPGMAFLLASTSFPLVVTCLVLLPPRNLADVSVFQPSRNKTAEVAGASSSSTASGAHVRTASSVLPSKRFRRQMTSPPPSRVVTDYEMDYPQVFETIETSTTRVPSKFSRFPFRGFVDPKCEKIDEGKMFADPTWCQRYFHCDRGSLNIYLCPELTVFSPQRQSCVHGRSQECSSSTLNLNIANWRRIMTNFYMTTDRAWVRARMLKPVIPMDRVTLPTDPPYMINANNS